MYKKTIFVLLVLAAQVLLAQQNTAPAKYALVIGNGNYTGLSRLTNPVNDASDVATVLQELGFTVERVLNGNLDQMESAVMRLKNRLSASGDSYGFFFYAGHGVQSNGENYLIPVDANIPGENFLRSRAVSMQTVLDELNDAHNSLNIVVLDACRDNPFGWARSGSRGLSIVGRQPTDSIVVYATSAGQTASDGTGRNGLFTGELLNNLRTPGLEVKEVFNRTGADVAEASNRQQIPAVYNQFFGTAYLGEAGEAGVVVARPSTPMPILEQSAVTSQAAIAAIAATIMPGAATGSLEIHIITPGTLGIIGTGINQMVELPALGSLPIEKINVGSYRVVMRYGDGEVEEKRVEVKPMQTAKLKFNYNPDPSRLKTIGVSLGTAFTAPVFAVTVQGSLAPWRGSFFDLGMDIGMGSGDADVSHFSLYPYVRYAFFWPFTKGGGWHAGAGVGLMYSTYTFPLEGKIDGVVFAADISTGVILRSGLTFSYTLRTNFVSASGKLAVPI